MYIGEAAVSSLGEKKVGIPHDSISYSILGLRILSSQKGQSMLPRPKSIRKWVAHTPPVDSSDERS